MPAAWIDWFVAEVGADLVLEFDWRDSAGATKDLTTYSAVFNLYQGDEAVLELTSGSEIALSDADPNILIEVGESVMSDLESQDAACWFLELTSGTGVVTRLAEGEMAVKARPWCSSCP